MKGLFDLMLCRSIASLDKLPHSSLKNLTIFTMSEWLAVPYRCECWHMRGGNHETASLPAVYKEPCIHLFVSPGGYTQGSDPWQEGVKFLPLKEGLCLPVPRES